MTAPTLSQEAAGGNLFSGSSTSPPELRAALRRLLAAVREERPVRVEDVLAVRGTVS
jgi:hypothetical protein